MQFFWRAGLCPARRISRLPGGDSGKIVARGAPVRRQMRAVEKRTKAGPAAGSLLLLAGFFWAMYSPAAAQGKPIQVCKRSPVGYRTPATKSPQDAADALRRKVNFTPWWIYRNTLRSFSRR